MHKISVCFKEFDEFFISQRINCNLDLRKLKIQYKLKKLKLYENDGFIMYYESSAYVEKNKSGERLLMTPSKIRIVLKNTIKYNDDFDYYIRAVENIFGFLICRKMTLISVNIISDDDNERSIISSNIKKYNDSKWEDLSVVDISSLAILKKLIKNYFENRILEACINNYYEYIYNNLDLTFEFVSLMNTLEMLTTIDKYNVKIKRYAKGNNETLKEENSIMKKNIKKSAFCNIFYSKRD